MDTSKNYFYLLLTLFLVINGYSQNHYLKTKKVSTLKSFFQALDNNTEIIIEADTLNFTLEYLKKELQLSSDNSLTSLTRKRVGSSYYLANDGIVLHGYNNLKIKGKNKVNIISYSDTDDILTLRECSNVSIDNLAIFHKDDTCMGMVLSLLYSKNISITNSSLNGSGAIGAYLIGSEDIIFKNVALFNNAFHAISSINSKNINFLNSELYQNNPFFTEETLIQTKFSELKFYNCTIYENQSEGLYNHNENIDDYIFYVQEEDYAYYYPEDGLHKNIDLTPYIPVFNDCTFDSNAFELPKIITQKKSDQTKITINDIFFEYFCKSFVKTLNDIERQYFYFSILELASFFSSSGVTLNNSKNKNIHDINSLLFHLIYTNTKDYTSNYSDFELVQFYSNDNNSFEFITKALKNKKAYRIKWTLTMDKDYKIIALHNDLKK